MQPFVVGIMSTKSILMDQQEKHCLDCGKVIRGRQDKKFCDDACRNNYNNKQNSDHTNYIRNVNNALRKNRRILAELLTGQNETAKVKRERLAEKGFQFNYHTGTYLTQKQQVYIFCYEYGYLPLEDTEWILIVKRNTD